MAIYLRELARNRIALIVWTVTMILFSVFLMTFFPTIREQAVELQRLMEQYPKELVAAFNFDRLKMADPMGFYGTQVYIFITLFGSIYAALLLSAFFQEKKASIQQNFY
jgi:ABC-2 type transport system permease protein